MAVAQANPFPRPGHYADLIARVHEARENRDISQRLLAELEAQVASAVAAETPAPRRAQ